jgi:hypothetical protein
MTLQALVRQKDAIHDERIDRLELTVRRRLGNRVLDFRVLVLNEGLVLLGHAATYHAKQLAQHAVMEETKVKILANDIEVQ